MSMNGVGTFKMTDKPIRDMSDAEMQRLSNEEIADMLDHTEKKMDLLAAALDDESFNNSPMRIDKRMRVLSKRIAEDKLAAEFEEGKQIKGITWTEERAILPHKCYATNETIHLGTMAYKGTQIIELLDTVKITTTKQRIWLTKEEFMIRRLKGQI